MTGIPELIRAAREGDAAACERVIVENSGLIWSVARRYFGQGAEPEDLYQLGCVGFLKAIKGYDESFGTQFSTYAVPKIAGEIRRFLRDDGQIKVSRTLKERAMSVRQARERLSQELGREPVLSEISEASGLSVDDIAAAELACMPAESLQNETGEDGFSLENVLGNDGIEESVVESVALREAVRTLSERERMVIELRYFRGFTQERVAKVLAVSQVQVSRIERRALASLREVLA